jgi:hypothetical protein
MESFTAGVRQLFWSNDRPTLLFWVLTIFVLSLIVYLVTAYVYGKQMPSDLVPTPTPLTKQIQLLSFKEASDRFSGSGSTVCGFFNVTMGDRTTHFQNTNTDNYTTLVGVKDAFEFQLAPAGVAMNEYAARVRIGIGSKKFEYLELPPMPQQKWIFLSILREGRRFDVMYNDQIVGSHRLDAYPVQPNNPLLVAPTLSTPRFLGTAVHVFAMNYRLSPSDLAVLRAQMSDTTGAPHSPLTFPLLSTFLSFLSVPDLRSFCIPGLPCSPVTEPPPNRMKMWASIYN